MQLGPLHLQLVDDGEFRLDGGAMFGVVPRVLWERKKPPDDRNRIQMVTHCPLVQRDDELLLIDTGIGDKNDEAFRDTFGMREDDTRLPEQIRKAGFEPEDVTHVVLTHLHFDHCGWNTCERNGKLVPTFPKATYWIERGELEHAQNPTERDVAGYNPDNWQPLLDAGQVELFDGEAEPMAGVRAVTVPGHTRNMAVVLLNEADEGPTGIFFADLIPTAAHVPYPWIMALDLYPMTTLEQKKEWIPRVAEEGWLTIFQHDPEMPFARLVEDRPGRYRAEEWTSRSR